MPDTIPLIEITLYKHGVGTFIRRGTVEGTELELPLRSGDVDDALKSLVVQSLDGGQVAAIHYPTPEDKHQQLLESPIKLDRDHSLFDLLRCLRGTRVGVQHQRGSVAGRVIGVEEHPQGREFGATLVLLTGSGTVEQIATDRLIRLELGDERLAEALGRYLDTSVGEEAYRTVRVALTTPGRHVQVMYTIPSPVWRVSYRFVGEVRNGERRGLLQGWAIFDNRLDEDLQQVDVRLVAGQPVSFRYDLTSSVIPQRSFIRDEARIAPGPVEFEGVAAAAPAPRIARLARAGGEQDHASNLPASGGRVLGAVSAPLSDQTMAGTLQTATGREMEELFEYHIGGVSVRRGESAMVPVAQHMAPYRRELLYNGMKNPLHPVAAFRMRNETGLTLERGPLTVVEDGEYRGEAMLPFTRTGAELVLAYAVELGITVREDVAHWTEVTGIQLDGAYLHFQEHFYRRITYTLTNATGEEQIVTIEHARWHGAVLADTRAPDEQTPEHLRWQIRCAPHSDTEFEVTERTLTDRREAVMDEDLRSLSEYLEGRMLDSQARQVVQQILRLRQAIDHVDERLRKIGEERTELGTRQDRLRQNLSIEATNENEEEIRRRSAEQFRRTQDREDELNAEQEHLQTEREKADAEVSRALGALE